MSKIAIDFGTARTKVAYFDEKSERPQVIELGREIRSILPSLFYIPRKGEVVVGDDAVEEGKTDRRGIVRGLKMKLDTKTPIRRNKRKVDRVELAAILFCNIKHLCETLHFHDEKITDCILTIPPMFSTSPNKLQAIEEAAHLGGFDKIEFIEEPVAAAKHWLAHGNTTTDYVFVCDIGGGTTDYALLKKISDSEDFQIFAELPPFSSKVGGNNIDNGIFEQLDLHGVDAQDKDAFLLQIRQYKEYVSRSPEKSPKITYKKQTITNLREIILDECGEFIHLLKSDIEIFIKKAQEIDSIDLTDIPLLLVGGGMNIHGLNDAFTEIWPGKVILWTESEHATVLGAISGGGVGPVTEADELFHKAMNLWNETLRGRNKLDDITQSYCFIDDVVNICDSSMEIVDRYPPSFNLKNILSSEKKLLDEIDKAKTAWEKKEFEKVIELCETALKFHPQKDDLPLPAIEYYDDDLVTQVMLIQAEAYDAHRKHKDAKRISKECTDRRPDLKSVYMLWVTTVLKGIKVTKSTSTEENWKKLIDTIDLILSLDDDNWGFGWSHIAPNTLLVYKAYAFFKLKELKSCQLQLTDIINNNSNKNKLDHLHLYNIILAYSYLKNNELDNASKLIENNILGSSSALSYIRNNQQFIAWATKEMELTPTWGATLNVNKPDELLDTVLKWWIDCNDIQNRDTLTRLYKVNSYAVSPWRYQSSQFIRKNADFLISMASVAAEIRESAKAQSCLKDLWISFPEVRFSEIVKDERLKKIIKEKFSPDISFDCSYEPFNNWIRFKNNTLYKLTNVKIIIHVYFKDYGSKDIEPLKSPIYSFDSNSTIPPTESQLESMGSNAADMAKTKYKDLYEDVFPHVRYDGAMYHSMALLTCGLGYLSDKNKINNVTATIECDEIRLLGDKQTQASKKLIR